uniref:Uncharacterized protein n=1 Tax=Trichogramma kaykai TaxID=54128 RepID=A0ABD2W4Y1_9HYME
MARPLWDCGCDERCAALPELDVYLYILAMRTVKHTAGRVYIRFYAPIAKEEKSSRPNIEDQFCARAAQLAVRKFCVALRSRTNLPGTIHLYSFRSSAQIVGLVYVLFLRRSRTYIYTYPIAQMGDETQFDDRYLSASGHLVRQTLHRHRLEHDAKRMTP